MTWIEHYAPKIAEIIEENKAAGKTIKEIKKILSSNNPTAKTRIMNLSKKQSVFASAVYHGKNIFLTGKAG